MISVIDLHYFGNVDYYSTLIKSPHIKFDLYVPWQKQGFLNRCTLSSANGPLNLSVPVIGGRNQKTPFREVKICYREDWRANHFKTIVSAYNRSPFFEHYRTGLEALYLEKEEYIWKWNLSCFKWSCSILNLNIKFELYESGPGNFILEEEDSWVDRRGKFTPGHPSLQDTRIIEYPQVFEDRHDFIPHLSILDLLFCMGPGALDILNNT